MSKIYKKISIDREVWRMARVAALLENRGISEWIEDRLRAELGSVLEQPTDELPRDEETADVQ